jgi:thiamine transport system permease protein
MAGGADALSRPAGGPRVAAGGIGGLGVAAGGVAALGAVLALTLVPVAALLVRAEPGRGLGPGEVAAIRFTLTQATLSAVLSCLLAVPVARALARRRFAGRRVFVALLGAPFLLPAIVAVLGLLAVWGRAGWASGALGAAGFGRLDIYGLTGVVLAHVFFNLPLVTRLLLGGWLAIPAEHFRLAAQLGMRPRDVFRHIEAPMLRAVLPGAFLLVFLLCVTSFAVALTLGGGPRATTVEVAIFQALRFDFDLGRAAQLALVQFGLGAACALVALRAAAPSAVGGGLIEGARRWDADRASLRALDAVVLVALALFLGLPLVAVFGAGLPALVAGLPPQVWGAAGNSLMVALASAATAFALALALAAFIDGRRARGRPSRLVEGVGLMTLAASPFVIGTGLFVILNPLVDPFALALPVTALVNAGMALPFALRVLLPALAEVRANYGMLADSLGMGGVARFRLVVWPQIRRPAGFATGLAAALSAGDLGVIALFAPPDVATLPLVMQRLMAGYRMADAAGAALVLLALTFGLFWLFDRGGRVDARA